MQKRLFTAAFAAVLSLALFAPAPLHTQAGEGGQFWVRTFEDRDADGVLDVGEPLLTRGVSVLLQDSAGIVIASALLDESPNAAQGLIGFQFLAPGTYTLVLAAPEVNATTDAAFTRTIEAGTLPTVVEFGGQRLDLMRAGDAAGTPASTARRGLFGLPIYLGEPGEVARLALAVLGALAIGLAMYLLGFLVYALAIRRPYRRALKALRLTTTTGSMRPITGPMEPMHTTTGPMEPMRTTTGSMRPVTASMPPASPYAPPVSSAPGPYEPLLPEDDAQNR
jgi:hypothetical protein